MPDLLSRKALGFRGPGTCESLEALGESRVTRGWRARLPYRSALVLFSLAAPASASAHGREAAITFYSWLFLAIAVLVGVVRWNARLAFKLLVLGSMLASFAVSWWLVTASWFNALDERLSLFAPILLPALLTGATYLAIYAWTRRHGARS